jgi:hypothetical protein
MRFVVVMDLVPVNGVTTILKMDAGQRRRQDRDHPGSTLANARWICADRSPAMQETPMTRKSREENQGKGKNLGQGLAGITDQQRRDLAASGDHAPTKDQSGRLTSGEQARQQNSKGSDTRH